jgi:hypothetical protein
MSALFPAAPRPLRAARAALFALLWLLVGSLATPGGVSQYRALRNQCVVELVLSPPCAEVSSAHYYAELNGGDLQPHPCAAERAIHHALRVCAAARVHALQQCAVGMLSPLSCSLGATVRSRFHSSRDNDPYLSA